MKHVTSVLLCAMVPSACGADGEPQQPVPSDGTTGVPVSGTAWTGMAVGDSGTRAFGGIALNNGPVTLALGF